MIDHINVDSLVVIAVTFGFALFFFCLAAALFFGAHWPVRRKRRYRRRAPGEA